MRQSVILIYRHIQYRGTILSYPLANFVSHFPSTPSYPTSLFRQTSSTTQQFGKRLDLLPPRLLSPSVLHICRPEYISDGRKDDLTSLNGDACGRFRGIASRDLVAALVGRLLRGRNGVLFQELHASKSETRSSSSVQR